MKTSALHYGVLVAMLGTVATGAFAAETADLTVKGVIRPSACAVALTGDGSVDYGTIAAKSLSDTAATKLPDRQVTMTMTCDAATKVGYKIVDNRASSASQILNSVDSGIANTMGFGLGASGGKNLGAFAIRALPADATGDGATIGGSSRSSDRSTWEGTTSVSNYVAPSMVYAWAATDGGSPASYKTVSQVLKLVGALNKTGDLPELTSNVDLDGSADRKSVV